MRVYDQIAAVVKSGGKTRRAAKMVMLDVDHPDIEEFLWCKAIEERKAARAAHAGLIGAPAHAGLGPAAILTSSRPDQS